MMQAAYEEDYNLDDDDDEELDWDALFAMLEAEGIIEPKRMPNCSVPEKDLGDYAILPLDFKGFYDVRPLFETDFESAEESLYTLMARLCIRVNRALMAQCNGLDYEATRDLAIAQFKQMHHTYHGPMNSDWVYYLDEEDEHYGVDFPLEEGLAAYDSGGFKVPAHGRVLLALCDISHAEFPQYMSERHGDLPDHEFQRCKEEFGNYIVFALRQLEQHWNDPFHTFVAYPFSSEVLFTHIDHADINQPIPRINFFAHPFTQATPTASRESLGQHYYPAIHLPTYTKQVMTFVNRQLCKVCLGR